MDLGLTHELSNIIKHRVRDTAMIFGRTFASNCSIADCIRKSVDALCTRDAEEKRLACPGPGRLRDGTLCDFRYSKKYDDTSASAKQKDGRPPQN